MSVAVACRRWRKADVCHLEGDAAGRDGDFSDSDEAIGGVTGKASMSPNNPDPVDARLSGVQVPDNLGSGWWVSDDVPSHDIKIVGG